MRALWGYDQKNLPKEPSAANPGGRWSVLHEPITRDPDIPDGAKMSREEFLTQMSALRSYADAKELNLTHTFRVSPHTDRVSPTSC